MQVAAAVSAGLLIFVILLVSSVTGRKRPLPHPRRCLIGAPVGYDNPILEKYADEMVYFREPFLAMNCTFVPSAWAMIGTVDGNGSYDGVVGIVQRNEVDFMPCLFPPDYFAVAPGFPLTSVVPLDNVIISAKLPPHSQVLTLVHMWLNTFDALSFSYILTCLFVLLVLLSFFGSMDHGPQSPVPFLRQMLQNASRTVCAFLDQENFPQVGDVERVLILGLNLFLLFLMHGIFSGALGADLVVDVDPPVIQSLEEFTNESQTQPVLIKQLFLRQNVQKSKPNSSLWHLKQVMAAHPNQSLVDVDLLSGQEKLAAQLEDLIQGISEKRQALIQPRAWYTVARRVGCALRPDQSKYIGRSESITSPVAALHLMSFAIDPQLRRVIERTIALVRESAFYDALSDIQLREELDKHVAPSFQVTSRCVQGVGQEAHEAIVFTVQLFEPFFYAFLASCSLALLVLVAEHHALRATVLLINWTGLCWRRVKISSVSTWTETRTWIRGKQEKVRSLIRRRCHRNNRVIPSDI